MGSVRRFLKRLVKPAAMVGAVGALSLSLVVTTPSTAQALVTYDKIKPAATFIMGATKTVAPAAMAVASFTPVGLGLRLAFLAFSTADLWLPLVTGAFGSPPSNEPADATTYRIKPGLKGVSVNARGAAYPGWITFQWTYVGAGTAQGIMFAQKGVCRSDSLSSGQPVGAIFNAATNSTASAGAGDSGYTYTINAKVCPDGSTIQSVTVGPPVTGSQYPGPENIISFGGSGGFDPRGANVGYQGRSECIDAQGTISWVEGPVTPGNNDGGTMLMPSCEKAGKGHGTGRTQVKGFKPDGTTETVWDTGTNPLSDPATPLCDPGRAGSGCVMEITKDGKPCASGDVECENWASEAPKDATGTRWKCKFGPYTLALSACGLLERAYVPGGSPLNDPNTDGNPDTRSPLGPDASAPPVSAPAPVIAPVPGSVPGTPGAPGPSATADESACWPTGWGMLNPLEWVYKPVVCAAKALFQPKKDIQARVTGMQSQFSNKVPVSWFGIAGSGVSGSSCPTDWAIEIRGHSYSLICGTPADGIIQSFRPVMGAMLIIAALWPLLRSLFYAAIPVFKVNPS